MNLVLVGLSHHVAPVELREQVALPAPRAAGLAAELAEACGEAVCLSTCNRTELYLAATQAGHAEALAVQVLGDLHGRHVLILGGGKMGTLSARNLVSRGAEVETIPSRTVGGEEVLRGVERADVVVSSTSTPGYVLTRDRVESVLAAR